MLRLRAWVFFLFLLLIGALLVATAPSFKACLDQTGPAAALSQPQRHGTTVTVARTTRDCLARFFTENRDDIIAGLALILALSTIFLWFATRDLVAGTADFSKQQLRAYPGRARPSSPASPPARSRRSNAPSAISARRPPIASVIGSRRRCSISTSDRFEPAEPEGGERIINPGRDGFTIKARLPEPLTEEEMSKIKLGTSAIYFYGVITYRDAFSRRRKTQFRYQHGGARLFGTEDLAISPQGNKAT